MQPVGVLNRSCACTLLHAPCGLCTATRTHPLHVHAGIAFGELAKVIGEKWAKLSAQEKAEYVKRFDEDKQRYAREMQDYALAREGAAGKALCWCWCVVPRAWAWACWGVHRGGERGMSLLQPGTGDRCRWCSCPRS